MNKIFICLILLPCILAQLQGSWIGTKVLRGISSPILMNIVLQGSDQKIDLFGGPKFSVTNGFLIQESGNDIRIAVVRTNITLQIGTLNQNGDSLTMVLNTPGNRTLPSPCETCATFSLVRTNVAVNPELTGNWAGTSGATSQFMSFLNNKMDIPSFQSAISVAAESGSKLFLGFAVKGVTSTASFVIDKVSGTILSLTISALGKDDLTCQSAPCTVFSFVKQDPIIDSRLKGNWFGLNHLRQLKVLSLVDQEPVDPAALIFSSMVSESGNAFSESNTLFNTSATTFGASMFYKTSTINSHLEQLQFLSMSFPAQDNSRALQILSNTPGNNARPPATPFIIVPNDDLFGAFLSANLQNLCPTCILTQYQRLDDATDPVLNGNWFGQFKTAASSSNSVVGIGNNLMLIDSASKFFYTKSPDNLIVVLSVTGEAQVGFYQKAGGCLQMTLSAPSKDVAPQFPLDYATDFKTCPDCQQFLLVCEGCTCDFPAGSANLLSISLGLVWVAMLALLL